MRWLTLVEGVYGFGRYLRGGIGDMPVLLAYGILQMFLVEQGFVLVLEHGKWGKVKANVYRRSAVTRRLMPWMKNKYWSPDVESGLVRGFITGFDALERRLTMQRPIVGRPLNGEGTEDSVVVGADVDRLLELARKKDMRNLELLLAGDVGVGQGQS